MTSRSSERRLAWPAAGVVLLGLLASPAAADDSTPSPTAITPEVGASADSLGGLSAPVRDIITTVESIDGAETQKDTGEKRTVILDSKVLFTEDRATISSAARKRLRSVAHQIENAGATGTVRIDGYTDNQGSAQHGLVLSRQRASAVRRVIEPLLAGADVTLVTLVTRGYGEAHPRFPNSDESGAPLPKNQAKNRRVEITFTPAKTD